MKTETPHIGTLRIDAADDRDAVIVKVNDRGARALASCFKMPDAMQLSSLRSSLVTLRAMSTGVGPVWRHLLRLELSLLVWPAWSHRNHYARCSILLQACVTLSSIRPDSMPIDRTIRQFKRLQAASLKRKP